MKTTEDCFLEDILANPNDIVNLLILADYVADQDPEFEACLRFIVRTGYRPEDRIKLYGGKWNVAISALRDLDSMWGWYRGSYCRIDPREILQASAFLPDASFINLANTKYNITQSTNGIYYRTWKEAVLGLKDIVNQS